MTNLLVTFLALFSARGSFLGSWWRFGASVTLHPERYRRLSPSRTDVMSETFTGAGKDGEHKVKLQ